MDFWQTQSTTRWWWIRHAPVPHLADQIYGNTDPDADVSDLTPFAQLARRLPADAVWFVSHLRRTTQTADAIRRAGFSLPELVVEPAFGEQDFGALHGVKHVDHSVTRADPYEGFWDFHPEDVAPDGESLRGVFNRVAAAVEQHSLTHATRDIVCVSHGGAILAAVAHALGIDPHTAVSLSIANLSLTRIERLINPRPGAPKWRVLGIGERAI